ncbi:Hypothetical protein NTJ_15109 [Nesidiocoris tenuis]|uniref:Uncharacterized protein n=1 Tax=Nesidiocoris tenuis TaxID=355587 RepID=A0ABN7BD34_9HEMI|nr:Hypothetical protein NTJ_15109 [Nesidiocoris tenuis]
MVDVDHGFLPSDVSKSPSPPKPQTSFHLSRSRSLAVCVPLFFYFRRRMRSPSDLLAGSARCRFIEYQFKKGLPTVTPRDNEANERLQLR